MCKGRSKNVYAMYGYSNVYKSKMINFICMPLNLHNFLTLTHFQVLAYSYISQTFQKLIHVILLTFRTQVNTLLVIRGNSRIHCCLAIIITIKHITLNCIDKGRIILEVSYFNVQYYQYIKMVDYIFFVIAIQF